jgi:hypothetical protein
MTTLFEDFRGHVAWGAAGRGQHVELLFVHDARQAKVGDEQVRIVFWRAEEEVLGLQIAVDNAMVVQIGHGGQRRPDQVCGVRLVVAALATYPVEEFSTQGEVGHQIHYQSTCQRVIAPPPQRSFECICCASPRTIVHRLEVIHQGQNVLMAHADPLQHGNLIPHHMLPARH